MDFAATNYRLDFLIFQLQLCDFVLFLELFLRILEPLSFEVARFFHSFPKNLATSVTLASGNCSCISGRRSLQTEKCVGGRFGPFS